MDVFEGPAMRNQNRARLSDRDDRQEPVITYSRMTQKDGDGRTEPRLTLVPSAREPRYRDEVAVPVADQAPDEDYDFVAPVVAPGEAYVDDAPRRRRGRGRGRDRRSGSGARLAVVVGILAVLGAFALLAVTYGGAVKTAVVTPSGDGDRILQPDAGNPTDATARVVTTPDAQTSTVTRAEPPPAVVVPPTPTPRPTLDAAGATDTASAPTATTSAPVEVAPPPGANAPSSETASAPPASDSIDSLMQSVDRIIANEKVAPADSTADTGPVDNGAAMDGDSAALPPLDDESGMPMDGSGGVPVDTTGADTGSGDTAGGPILLNDAPVDLSGAADQYTTSPPARRPFLADPDSEPVPPADIPNPGSNYSSW